jgi:hypothetical protein
MTPAKRPARTRKCSYHPTTHPGRQMIEVTMVETGEKAEYRLTHLSDDPEVH